MDQSFLLEANWPVFGQGTLSGHSKTLYDWCGKISKFVLQLSDRVKQLEEKEIVKNNEITKLKSDLVAANNFCLFCSSMTCREY